MRRTRQIPATLVLLLAAGASGAQVSPDDGIPIGPWIIAPVLEAELEIDDNVRRAPEEAAADDPVERIASTKLEIEAKLPFRKSMLELNYGADLLDYRENQFDTDVAQDLGFRLDLQFGTGDKLVLSDTFSEDFARIETLENVDRGGELTFIGEPYRINTWTAQLERAIQNRPGYLLQVRRTDFNYQGEADVDFFDYRGFDNAAEYRHPLPGNRWLLGRYDWRRFEHFDPDDPVGVPFRREKSDTVLVGLLGELGDRQPFSVRLGYGRFRYDQLRTTPTEFSGLIGVGSWQLRLGDRTDMTLELVRQPLPSSFETYYVYNLARVELERQIVRSTEGRLELRLSRNRYGDAVFSGCGGEVRDDKRWQLGGELEWEVHPRFGFEMAVTHEQRGSNCEFADYETSTVGIAIKTGWF